MLYITLFKEYSKERKVYIDKFENGEICLIGMAYNESTCKEMESKIIELKNRIMP